MVFERSDAAALYRRYIESRFLTGFDISHLRALDAETTRWTRRDAILMPSDVSVLVLVGQQQGRRQQQWRQQQQQQKEGQLGQQQGQ